MKITQNFRISAFSLLITLTSCTTEINKEQKFIHTPGKYKTLNIEWVNTSKMPISVWAPYAVTESSKEAAGKKIFAILDILKFGVSSDLKTRLGTTGVCFAPRDKADVTLFVQPVYGSSRCGIAGCSGKVEMSVKLVQREFNATAWIASISTGAPWLAEQTSEVADDFYKAVSARVLDTGLIENGGCRWLQ